MPPFYRLAILLLLVSTWSCNVESLGDPIIVPVVDQEFSFRLWQNLSTSSTSPLEIHISTLENYECLNTSILANYTRTDNRLELTLFDILDPEVCDPGPAPAFGTVAVDNIEESIYDLRIELQDVVNNLGSLLATSEKYTVAMQDENGISWLQYELYRIPENAIWGYVSYTNEESRTEAEGFIAELAALGSANTLPDGYYGHYTLKDSGNGLDLNVGNAPEQNLTFIFEYDGPLGEISQQVNEFVAQNNEPARLQIWDGQGNEWEN